MIAICIIHLLVDVILKSRILSQKNKKTIPRTESYFSRFKLIKVFQIILLSKNYKKN